MFLIANQQYVQILLQAAAMGLAHCQLNVGFFDEALEGFKKVAEERPDDVEAHQNREKVLQLIRKSSP